MAESTSVAAGTIAPWDYYKTYLGHPLEHLAPVLSALRTHDRDAFQQRPVIFLAGDSTLDNKHWLFRGKTKGAPESYADESFCADALGGYSQVLSHPRMVKDLAYWLTAAGNGSFAALNTAVEESTLKGRADRLTAQDEFIRDNIGAGDILVISAGGNDVALRPTAATARAVMGLMAGREEEAMAYFEGLFKTEVEAFASALVAKVKPRAVIVCMLYFLDENSREQGFADATLRQLGYDSNPAFLQGIIRAVFERAVRKVTVEGTEVIPLGLFEALDGKDTRDYVDRVEPSVSGGEKLARLIAGKAAETLGVPSSKKMAAQKAAPGGACVLQ